MSGRLGSWLKAVVGGLRFGRQSGASQRRSWDEMRRGEVRRDVQIDAIIEWVDWENQLVRTPVVIEDESVFGYRIRLGQSLPAGRTVWISSD